MITPFQDRLINKENDVPILSYGLSSYGYDIRLSPSQCLLFGGVQHGMCDAKNFDPEILKETELHEDELLRKVFYYPSLRLLSWRC